MNDTGSVFSFRPHLKRETLLFFWCLFRVSLSVTLKSLLSISRWFSEHSSSVLRWYEWCLSGAGFLRETTMLLWWWCMFAICSAVSDSSPRSRLNCIQLMTSATFRHLHNTRLLFRESLEVTTAVQESQVEVLRFHSLTWMMFQRRDVSDSC